MNCCSGDCKTDLLPYITHQEEESFQHAEDMKCVDRNSGSLLKKVTADERKLRSFEIILFQNVLPNGTNFRQKNDE